MDRKKRQLSIKQNMAWNSIGSLTYLGLQWLITILVVRMEGGYAAAGSLSLAMTVYGVFQPLAMYRMYTYQVSDVKRENTLGEYMSFRVITSAIAILGCCVYAFLTCPTGSFVAILLYALFKTAGLLIDVLHGEDQLAMRMDLVGKSLIVQGVTTFVAFCFLFMLTSSIEWAVFGMFVATCFVGLFYDLPRTRHFSRIKLGIRFKKILHLSSYCLPIVLAGVACAITPSVPRQVLMLTQGDVSLGLYASVAAPAAIIQMGASYIYNPLLSLFASKYAASDSAGFITAYRKALLAILAIGIVGVVGYSLIAPWLLVLVFGEGIRSCTYLAMPVAIMTSVSAVLWFSNDLLISIRAFRPVLVANTCSFVASIALSFGFVGMFGMNGVSFAVILSYGIALAISLAAIAVRCKKMRAR